MKRNFLKVALFSIVLSVVACKSTSDSNNNSSSRPERQQGNDRQERGGQQGGERGQRPTSDQIMAQMDTNNDGKLAKSEIKGPIKNDFSTIDSDNDGFITKEELDNAPKPERGQQGGNRQGGGQRR